MSVVKFISLLGRSHITSLFCLNVVFYKCKAGGTLFFLNVERYNCTTPLEIARVKLTVILSNIFRHRMRIITLKLTS